MNAIEVRTNGRPELLQLVDLPTPLNRCLTQSCLRWLVRNKYGAQCGHSLYDEPGLRWRTQEYRFQGNRSEPPPPQLTISAVARRGMRAPCEFAECISTQIGHDRGFAARLWFGCISPQNHSRRTSASHWSGN
jgi:hypothetical protein